MKNRKRLLFAFEGIDGSGKTTQVKILQRKLERNGYSVFVSKASLAGRKSSIGYFIKRFGFGKNSISTMLLFQSLHANQLEKALRAMEENRIVLADRWNASFWVYHQNFGSLRGLPDYLKTLDEIAFQGILPTITFLLDLPINIAFKRRNNRAKRDVFEEEKHGVYSIARDAYLKIAAEHDNWLVIDAGKLSKKEVHAITWKEIQTFLDKTE